MMGIKGVEKFKAALLNITMLLLVMCITLIASSLFSGLDVGEVFTFFIRSSVGSTKSTMRMLMRATPILISTLGLIIAFRGGIWNIGGEGQILVGVIVSAGICLFIDLHPFLAIPLALLASFLAGGAYGGVAGFLKARWDVNEIAVTMMQNFIASALLQYLIDGPWNWGKGLYPRTEKIPSEMRLPLVIYPLNTMFLVGVALTMVTYILLNKTVFGFELQAMRSNRKAALSHGIDVDRLTVLTMLVSGGLCGIAGAGLVLGEYFRAQAGISGNYGFYAIATALMAYNSAFLAPFTALFIAFIYQGVLGLTALGMPQRLGEAMIGVVFIVILLPRIVKVLGV